MTLLGSLFAIGLCCLALGWGVTNLLTSPQFVRVSVSTAVAGFGLLVLGAVLYLAGWR